MTQQDEQHEQPDASENEATPTEASSGDDSRMTFREMRAALDDESHPRHDEALSQSKEMADKLKPAMESLGRQVRSQMDFGRVIKGFKTPSVADFNPGWAGAATADALRDTRPVFDPEELLPDQVHIRPAIAADRAQAIDFAELTASMDEAMQERVEREERQDATAEASLDALQAMAANLQQLNLQMESVERQLEGGNRGARTSFWWTIAVASLTLLATMTGIVVTLLLTQAP